MIRSGRRLCESPRLRFASCRSPAISFHQNVGAHRLLSTKKPGSPTDNASRFRSNKHLQRARLKGELRPMLSLAIHSFLVQKQERLIIQNESNDERDFSAAVGMLARWHGYQPIDPSNIVNTKHFQNGRLHLGQGLVAEPAAFATENYIVLARKCATPSDKEQEKRPEEHPPFTKEDASWYHALEARVNDNLDHWEENARKRRQMRLQSAKQGVQYLLDKIQYPAAKAFGAVTARLGPAMDQIRATVRSNVKQVIELQDGPSIQSDSLPDKSKGNSHEEGIPKETVPATCEEWNDTDPDDLIILTKDGGSLMLLNNVNPRHRLLALPVVTTDGKVKPPYRLRLARGGLVISVSILMLGALPPTYRSLRFILEYPKTAEIVMITLVASFTYNLWSWSTNARTRQRELIAAAVQSRLVARDEAALSFLTAGAVDTLTDVLMESYVSRLLSPSGKQAEDMDPLVAELGESAGLFRPPEKQYIRNKATMPGENQCDGQEIVAVEWEKARSALVYCLAPRL